jgi:hypothetical protein
MIISPNCLGFYTTESLLPRQNKALTYTLPRNRIGGSLQSHFIFLYILLTNKVDPRYPTAPGSKAQPVLIANHTKLGHAHAVGAEEELTAKRS